MGFGMCSLGTLLGMIGISIGLDQVYKALGPYGVTVAGGRITGVGVGGLSLGGGYSWISNSVGLSIDNILEYELVLPSGQIVIVNSSTYPDLFFGLKVRNLLVYVYYPSSR